MRKDRIASVLEGLNENVEIRFAKKGDRPRYTIMTQYLNPNIIVSHDCLTTATREFNKQVQAQRKPK